MSRCAADSFDIGNFPDPVAPVLDPKVFERKHDGIFLFDGDHSRVVLDQERNPEKQGIIAHFQESLLSLQMGILFFSQNLLDAFSGQNFLLAPRNQPLLSPFSVVKTRCRNRLFQGSLGRDLPDIFNISEDIGGSDKTHQRSALDHRNAADFLVRHQMRSIFNRAYPV